MTTPNNNESSRIMIAMELSHKEFDVQLKEQFLNDLSKVLGSLREDIKDVYVRSGCIRFHATVPIEVAEKLLELWELIERIKSGESELNLELKIEDIEEFKELVRKYKITEIEDKSLPSKTTLVSTHYEEDKQAIVFIHGWRGNESAFGKMPEFLCRYVRCSKEVYSYPTSWTNGESIILISRNLENWVRRKCRENGYTKLAFVAHSMGGLVVKKLLVSQVYRRDPITNYLKEITFIATPHNGAPLAKFPKLIPGLNTQQVRELAPGSSFLLDLNDYWAAWKSEFVPEYCRYGCIFGTEDEVVDTTNAPEEDLGNAFIFGAKHVDIVKPESPEDEVVLTVVDHLKEAGFFRKSLCDHLPAFEKSKGR